MSFPGLNSPSAGFEEPFELLHACHERVQRTLQLLDRLQEYLLTHPVDNNARSAAADVLRYFDLAAPLHHQDEEMHVFPPLLANGDEAIREAVHRLQEDHRQMQGAWLPARKVLQSIAEGNAASWTPLRNAQTQALLAFSSLYAQHIETEEQVVYPQARRQLTHPALAAMRQDMMSRRGVTAPVQSMEKVAT